MATKQEEDVKKELTEAQKAFCRHYILDWNGSRSYKAAYPGVTDDTAKANASRLLANANVQAYWKALAKDDEQYTGISRRYIIMEHKKIVDNGLSKIQDTWISKKEFEELSEETKGCISQIETQTRIEMGGLDGETPIQVDYVKLKLYDKQKSLDSLSKMFGYNEPEKMVHDLGAVKSFSINAASRRKQGN